MARPLGGEPLQAIDPSPGPDANGRMKRPERILHLVALFLGAPEPVSFQKIQALFPDDYARGSKSAARRMFERDKVTLAELGLTLEYVPARQEPEAEEEGYRLCRDEWRARPTLGDDERAALLAAGALAHASALCIEREELGNALRKIALSDPDPFTATEPWRWIGWEPHVSGPEEQHHLDLIWRALIDRRRVSICYATAEAPDGLFRQVDPWALTWERGAFSLKGFCRLRGAARTFRLSRMRHVELGARRSASPDFARPAVAPALQAPDPRRHPWLLPVHRPIEVEVALARPFAPFIDRLFPGSVRLLTKKAEIRLRVEVTCLDNLIAHVLRQGPGVRVLSPIEAVERLCAMARAARRAHGGDGGAPGGHPVKYRCGQAGPREPSPRRAPFLSRRGGSS